VGDGSVVLVPMLEISIHSRFVSIQVAVAVPAYPRYLVVSGGVVWYARLDDPYRGHRP